MTSNVASVDSKESNVVAFRIALSARDEDLSCETKRMTLGSNLQPHLPPSIVVHNLLDICAEPSTIIEIGSLSFEFKTRSKVVCIEKTQ